MLVDEDVPTVLGRLRVRVGGEGPAMLFWPSLMMDGSMWTAQADHFADTHRVVLVDPPGHGASEPLERTFTFDECAQCVVQVLDALDIDKVHFVGNSWGGMIGGTFAARHPDRVATATLMNCTASPAGLYQKVKYETLRVVAPWFGGIRGPLVRPAVDAFVGRTLRRTKPDVLAWITAQVKKVDVLSIRWAVVSVVPRRPDQHALISGITAPVLVIAGTEDATFPPAEARRMANAIPGARYELLPDTAHLAAVESPDQVNALMDSLLASYAQDSQAQSREDGA
jgi:3-oxoadipate enol-lactonase